MRVSLAAAALCSALFSFVLADDSLVKVLTKSNYDDAVKSGVVMVKYYAPWCGHCKKLAPEFEKAANELKESAVTLAKVDCTVETEICSAQGIQGYPTVKVFRDGFASEYGKARSADAIVSYLKKQLQPAVVEVTTDNAEEFIKSDKVVVVGYFTAQDSDEYNAFSAIASKLRDDFTFGITVDSEVAKEQGIEKQPAIQMFKRFDENKSVYPENADASDFSEESIMQFVTVNSVPLMDDIGPENYQKYVSAGLPLTYLFVADDKQRESVGQFVEVAAKKYRGKINFVYIDANQFGGHAKSINLKEEWPALGIHDLKSNSKYPFNQANELTEESVAKFIEEFVAGKLTPDVKSQPIPESNDEPVKVVVAKNFKEIVLDESKDVLIEFYAPWCGHCKKLAPIYDELAEKLKANGDLVIAKMDATENDIPPGLGFEIEGFPTLKLFKAKTNEIVDYNGDRSLDSFLDFLKSNSIQTVGAKEEKSEEDHDEL